MDVLTPFLDVIPLMQFRLLLGIVKHLFKNRVTELVQTKAGQLEMTGSCKKLTFCKEWQKNNMHFKLLNLLTP